MNIASIPKTLGGWLGAFAFLALASVSAEPVRVACVGGSITRGVGTPTPFVDSYPALLQRMLGRDWVVGNFGSREATVITRGEKPYRDEPLFQKALAFKPDIVVFLFGTYDTRPEVWEFGEQFVRNYKSLIQEFRELDPKPRIFVCTPPHVAGAGNYGITQPALALQLPLLDRVIEAGDIERVDVYRAFGGNDNLLHDRVHPNRQGAEVIARTVYARIVGERFEGEIPPPARTE